jgi:uroporphyrin-III C-methyltransferase
VRQTLENVCVRGPAVGARARTAGTVFLVGAGPGDPDLLTVRAARLLARAEVIAADALVPQSILALAPSSAERIDVGYRCGENRPRAVMHPAILERARAGRDVVRLKAGDPTVFGRAGEEAEALHALGIPFEIVPGVSAAFAAAAAARIPLTDRRLAAGVTIASGHHAGERQPPATRVLYMARQTLRESLAGLRLQGTSGATAAALVAGASRTDQRIVFGTVGDLAERVERAAIGPELPAVVIVGDVVALARRLSSPGHETDIERYARAG